MPLPTAIVATADVRAAVTPEILEGLRRYHLGWLCLVLALAAFVVAQAAAPGTVRERGVPLDLLTAGHASIAALLYLSGVLVPRRAFFRVPPSTPEGIVELVRYLSRGRIALVAMVAIAGWLVCLLGVRSGRIHLEPAYWANSATTGVLFVYVAGRWPTADRLAGIYEAYG